MLDARQPSVTLDDRPLELVSNLCAALSRAGVTYCHWKSNEALARSATGANDLDLLVDRRDAGVFVQILSELTFVRAEMPSERRSPGVDDYYGLDATGRLVHVHAHYRLVLGDDATKNYRLPVEEAYLSSATKDGMFMIPSPEFEYIVFVIRMILKHANGVAIMCLKGSLSASERRELYFLRERVQRDGVAQILRDHLSFLDDELFERCERAIEGESPFHVRMRTAADLQRRLAPWARRPQRADAVQRLWRGVYWRLLRYAFNRPPRRRLPSGGKLIAIVGGDGAGKSSTVRDLSESLSQVFVVDEVHLGKPPQSLASSALRFARVARRFVLRTPSSTPFRTAATDPQALLDLLWYVLLARDRYRAYLKARRFVEAGGIVVCDRYPVREIRLMDGPKSNLPPPVRLTRMGRRLTQLEHKVYERIEAPDILIVLRVDPEIAVQRRTDEDADFVRTRCAEIWHLDWEATRAWVVDTDRSQDQVLADVKSLVWREL